MLYKGEVTLHHLKMMSSVTFLHSVMVRIGLNTCHITLKPGVCTPNKYIKATELDS